MSLEEFAADLAEILRRSPVAPGRPLRWTMIANPAAGGFTMAKRWREHRQTLDRMAREAALRPLRPEGAEPAPISARLDDGDGSLGRYGLLCTRRPAHAGEIVRELIDEAEAEAAKAGRKSPFHLIITAGGDGTSLEALTALYHAPATLKSSFAILRLPMGTGNDGADARELSDALRLLTEPTQVEYQRAVSVSTATPGKGPYLSFNITSVGLDAFVTHMTNRMKGHLPGDSYKLWVDLATLFYDRIYKVGELDVRALDGRGHEVEHFREKLLLLAVGASGHRAYGSNKKILPDDRNVCAIRQVSLRRKIALKGLFMAGLHADRPEARMFSAATVEISGRYPILAQTDGESIRIEPRDFPIRMTLTEPAIPVLRLLQHQAPV